MTSHSQGAPGSERSGSSHNGQRTTDNGPSANNGRVPDALMLPEGRKQGTRMVDRVTSIAGIAEPLLQVDRARGERAYIRLQGNGKLFVSKSVFDTIVFPKDHQRDGQPRYRWELQPDGAEFGFLISE
jgi:hypothetical protein